MKENRKYTNLIDNWSINLHFMTVYTLTQNELLILISKLKKPFLNHNKSSGEDKLATYLSLLVYIFFVSQISS